jgi:6-phosphogluconolactonase/glucosamine-6-phosphate isomerase/deaminase
MTFPLISRAKEILFLVEARGKGSILEALLKDPQRVSELYPAARVRSGSRKKVRWFVCRAAD